MSLKRIPDDFSHSLNWRVTVKSSSFVPHAIQNSRSREFASAVSAGNALRKLAGSVFKVVKLVLLTASADHTPMAADKEATE